jgi:hypothetical protein
LGAKLRRDAIRDDKERTLLCEPVRVQQRVRILFADGNHQLYERSNEVVPALIYVVVRPAGVRAHVYEYSCRQLGPREIKNSKEVPEKSAYSWRYADATPTLR